MLIIVVVASAIIVLTGTKEALPHKSREYEGKDAM
jgi:hypothetical protein